MMKFPKGFAALALSICEHGTNCCACTVQQVNAIATMNMSNLNVHHTITSIHLPMMCVIVRASP